MAVTIRQAQAVDIETIVRLVNQAYEAERFFVLGDRTGADEIRAKVDAGRMLVAVEEAVGAEPVGCVDIEAGGDVGAFGMLAVDPSRQRGGIGRALIVEAERRIRDAGGRFIEIHVVNLRADLLPRYRRLGYTDAGTAPYVHRPTVQPCHFVVMRKAL